MKIKFYHVSDKYLSYLSMFDDKVPDASGIEFRHQRFFCGIILKVNNVNYFAPISSKTKAMASNVIILNRHKRPLGSIGLSHMFPVPLSEVKIKDFSKEEKIYRDLLSNELFFCNKNRGLIYGKAAWVYREAHIPGSLMNNVCCDFALLEAKCREFQNDFEIELE